MYNGDKVLYILVAIFIVSVFCGMCSYAVAFVARVAQALLAFYG